MPETYSPVVAFDASGNMFVAYTYTESSAIKGKALPNAVGQKDIALAKVDPAGNVLWAKAYGGTDTEFVFAIAVDSAGDVFLSGSFLSPTISWGGSTLTRRGAVVPDPFVGKVSGVDGSPSFAFGPSTSVTAGAHSGGDCGHLSARGTQVAVACALRGPVEIPVLAGGTATFPAPGVNNTRTVIALLDAPSGKARWATTVGGTLNDLPTGIHIAPQGHLLVSMINGSAVAEDPSKSFTLTRKSDVADAAILRLSAVDGKAAWAQGFGASGTEVRINSVLGKSNGDVLFAGHLSGPLTFGTVPATTMGSDLLIGVAKGESGAVTDVRTYGAPGNSPEDVTAGVIDVFDEGFFAGFFNAPFSMSGTPLPDPGGISNLLFKATGPATPLWAKGVASSAAAVDFSDPSLAIDPVSHGVAVGGSYQGTANFGDGNPVASAGTGTLRSGFVVRRAP
jgi:hypothetical protein